LAMADLWSAVACGQMDVCPFAVRQVKEAHIGHVPSARRDDDPRVASVCPGADTECRHRRRSGAGHAGAGAALRTSVSWRRRTQLAVHDPDEPQPKSAAVAGTTPHDLADRG